MKVTIRKPTARELDGLRDAADLADADAQEMRLDEEPSRRRKAEAIFAGLMWLDEVLRKVEAAK